MATIPTSYGCVNGYSISGDPAMCMTTGPDGMQEPIDCGKAGNCSTRASAPRPSAASTRRIDTKLDAALGGDTGDELTGTLVLGGERIVVRMTRE